MSVKIINTIPDAIAKLEKAWKPLAEVEVEVGSMGPGGTPTPMHDEAKMPVSSLLKIHEFGLGGVPQRSVIRATLAKRRKEIGALMRDAAVATLRGTAPEQAADVVGKGVVPMLIDRLDELSSVEPLTVKPDSAPEGARAPKPKRSITIGRRISRAVGRLSSRIKRFFGVGRKARSARPKKTEPQRQGNKPLQVSGQIRESLRYHVAKKGAL